MSTETKENIINEIYYSARRNENGEDFEHIYLTRHLIKLTKQFSKSPEENIKNIFDIILFDFPLSNIDADDLNTILKDRLKLNSHTINQNTINYCEHVFSGYRGKVVPKYNDIQYAYFKKKETITFLIKEIFRYFVTEKVLREVNKVKNVNDENSLGKKTFHDYMPVLVSCM